MPRLRRDGATLDAAALFAPLFEFRRMALAVSGGPDSLALMLLAHQYARQTEQLDRFVVYTVDHGLRAEAADEAAFVVSEAGKLGFAARSLRWDGPKPATGIQEAARQARYRLFFEAMRLDKADVLVTAHHLADQAETVLMRLAHGSGIEGLRGMDWYSEVGGLRIVRPLLAVVPEALRQVVAAAGLVPVTDPSNSDIDYERVRWRQLMPQLAAFGLTPQRLAKFAERMRDADRTLNIAASAAWQELEVAPDMSRIRIDRHWLQGLPRAVAIRVVERALGSVGGWQKPHALAAVETLTDRLRRESVRSTLHGCVVRSDDKSVIVTRETGRVGRPQALPEPATP